MTEADLDFLSAAALSALVGPISTEAMQSDITALSANGGGEKPAIIARSCFQVALAMLEARKMIVEGEKL